MSTAPPSKPPVRSATTQLPAVPGTRSLASVTPFGWNLPGVHPWRSLWSTLVDNLDNLPAAWSVLAHGVCDRSSLGVAGLHDGLPGGFHIDETRRHQVRSHTQPPIAPADLLELPRLRAMAPSAMARLGRLASPYIHRAGDRGFTKVGWDEALRAIAAAVPKPNGKRMAFLAGEESLSIEAAYALSKTARLLTSAHVDLLPPSPPSDLEATLGAALGTPRSTASTEDILDAQVVFVVGTQLSTAESRARALLLAAKRRGARIVVINPVQEPALAQVRSQTHLPAALFGVRLADDFVEVAAGGDAAFFTGVAKAIVERKGSDTTFVHTRTNGLDHLSAALAAHTWSQLEAAAGCPRRDMEWVAELAVRAERGVTLIGTGLARHPHAAAAAGALANLHLLRGWFGTDGTGILPLATSIGRPGAQLVGVAPTHLPNHEVIGPGTAAELSKHWGGHFVPVKPGQSATELPALATQGELDLLVCLSAHLQRDLRTVQAFEHVGVRVFLDTVVRPSMALEGAALTVLLPIDGFYAQAGGATVHTADARIRFSPQVLPSLPLARPPWEALAALATTLDPELETALYWPDAAAIRREVATVVPTLAGIDALSSAGDWIQPGGRHAGTETSFPTASGRADFVPVPLASAPPLQVVPRRAPPVDSTDRKAVLISHTDAKRVGLHPGDSVRVTTDSGQFQGRARLITMPAGAVHVCLPEAADLFGDAAAQEPTTAAITRGHT